MRTKIHKQFLLLLTIVGLLGAMPSVALAENDLVSMLTSQLGVSEEQATGGVGAIFDYAKENLSAEDFSNIAKGVPGMDKFLGAVPAADSGSAMSALGGLMGDNAGSLGGLASLAGSFESLGLDADTVSKFLPIVEEYIGSVSGEDAMKLLSGLF